MNTLIGIIQNKTHHLQVQIKQKLKWDNLYHQDKQCNLFKKLSKQMSNQIH